jgi:Ca2+-binding EF-hand superfamily protein
VNTLQEKQRLVELERLFKKFDEDGSGTLDMNEFYSMFKSVGIELGPLKMKQLFSNKGVLIKKSFNLREF